MDTIAWGEFCNGEMVLGYHCDTEIMITRKPNPFRYCVELDDGKYIQELGEYAALKDAKRAATNYLGIAP